MPVRSNTLRLMSALLALSVGPACSLDPGLDGHAGGGSAEGGSEAEGPTELGYEEIDGTQDPPSDGGASNEPTPACETGVRFELPPNATHARASAAFAVAALDAGTWPNINRSLLRHDEFLAHFARSSSSEPFARVRSTPTEDLLDLFVTVPSDGKPMHLILVVDTSTSMRNDLVLAGEIVSAFGGALGKGDGDHLTIVEWGSDPEIFVTAEGASTVPSAQAAGLTAEFSARVASLTQAQLGPGGSLGPAQAAVDAAIDAAEESPHIVVLTDGGVEADGDAFAAIESWAIKRSAVISFIEIAGGSEDAAAQPRSFHREQLASLAAAGGGLTHFVTGPTLASLMDDFDGNFRVGRRGVLPTYEMAGVTALLSYPGAEIGLGGFGSALSGRWSGVGRPVFTSVGVATCGAGEFEGKVTLDGATSDVLVGDPDDERVVRLSLIDQLFHILSEDCEGALPLIEDFGETDGPNPDLRSLVDRAKELCTP